jgi:TetR/AcrR family fatty acid metabolism transcriptional regulator
VDSHRVQIHASPWGETVSAGTPGATVSDAETLPSSIDTRPGRTRTYRRPRHSRVRSRSARVSRSHTAQNVWTNGPTWTTPAHSMSRAPYIPTYRQRLSGRPFRTSGRRDRSTGRSAGFAPVARHGRTSFTLSDGIRSTRAFSTQQHDPGERLDRPRGPHLMGRGGGAEKRRIILDAAVVVFARQGFHAARVSDIADQAGVAYGLVYHYFKSKDEVLDTLFLERWDVLLEAIREVDRSEAEPREKLHAITSFIVDSYRHDPDLMKVIIVEVTRAANSFGARHLAKIREAYELIATIVADAQSSGKFRDDIAPTFAAMAFYGAIEQVLTGWIFGLLPNGEGEFEHAKTFVVETVCGGLEAPAHSRI